MPGAAAALCTEQGLPSAFVPIYEQSPLELLGKGVSILARPNGTWEGTGRWMLLMGSKNVHEPSLTCHMPHFSEASHGL